MTAQQIEELFAWLAALLILFICVVVAFGVQFPVDAPAWLP